MINRWKENELETILMINESFKLIVSCPSSRVTVNSSCFGFVAQNATFSDVFWTETAHQSIKKLISRIINNEKNHLLNVFNPQM